MELGDCLILFIKNMVKPLKVATAFSGGLAAVEFAIKYESIKHEIVFACEWDKYARKQYLQFHAAPATFHEDISDLDAKKYKNKIDLFVWGSPCQDVSLSGKREGFDGQKSKFFREGARVQNEMKPKIFIYENVLGLLSSNNGNDYEEVLRTFRTQGYSIVTTRMNTKDYGVPQNRDRIFIIGFLNNADYQSFTPPIPKKLKTKLKDILQPWIPEKYFLSQKMIDGFITHTDRHSIKGNRFKFKPTKGDKVAACLHIASGNKPSDDYIKIKTSLQQLGNIDQKGHNSLWGRVYSIEGISSTVNANGGGAGAKTGLYLIKTNTKQGFKEIRRGDSLNFTFPNSKTRRGRIGKEIAQTLDCACNQGVVEPQIGALRGRNPQNPKLRVLGLPTKQMLEINKNGTSNCLTSVQKDNVVLRDFLIRRLIPFETFLLQGLRAEDIKIVVSDTQAYKISGNAQSVNVLQELLKALYKKEELPKNSLFDF